MTPTSTLLENPYKGLNPATEPFYRQALHCIAQAALLLEDEMHWIRGVEAADDNYQAVPAYDWDAAMWSIEGAVKFEDEAYVNFFRDQPQSEPAVRFPSDLALDLLRWQLVAMRNHGQHYSVEEFNDGVGRAAAVKLLEDTADQLFFALDTYGEEVS